MGLFRKLLGREPVWTQRWNIYSSDLGNQLAMYNVDLGAVDVAPVAKLPLRVDVEFSYTGDGASGMPDDAELRQIRSLEDAIDKAMRALGGAYVGRVLSGNTGRLTGYLPKTAPAPALPAVALRPQLTLTPDPAWSRVLDELAPDAWQRNMIEDLHLVQALEGHGDRLDAEREVEHLGYFPDEARAEESAAALRATGFAVTVGPDDEGGFELQAIRSDPVEPPGIHSVSWQVRTAVEGNGGVYDGWGCAVQIS
jgi:hypothetical protein